MGKDTIDPLGLHLDLTIRIKALLIIWFDSRLHVMIIFLCCSLYGNQAMHSFEKILYSHIALPWTFLHILRLFQEPFLAHEFNGKRNYSRYAGILVIMVFAFRIKRFDLVSKIIILARKTVQKQYQHVFVIYSIL